MKDFYLEVLGKDSITLDSFKTNPNLEYRSSGTYRRIVQNPKDFKYEYISYLDCDMELAESELNKFRHVRSHNDRKEGVTDTTSRRYHGAKLCFSLPPGSYATMLLRELTKESTDTLHQASLTLATSAGK
jgi:tRNA pseudouridine13 synthase